MFRRITALLIVVFMCFLMCSCTDEGSKEATQSTQPVPAYKVGVMLVADKEDSSSIEHTDAIGQVAQQLKAENIQTVFKYSVEADESCYDTAKQLVDEGCSIIFSNSKKHQEFIEKAADEFSDVEFVVFGGDTAKTAGIDNLHNAYTDIYQARYVCGVVAGLKIKDLMRNDKLSNSNYDADKNIKIGYVGTLPSSEVVSSYSGFYLGVKSICKDVAMSVQYTNKQSDKKAEKETADALISQGCVIIAQHNVTTAVSDAVNLANKSGKVCYCVGFGSDMSKIAPNGALVSAKHNWEVCYKDIITLCKNDDKIPTDWIGGYDKEAVGTTELTDNCSDKAFDEVEKTSKALATNETFVFDTSTFTSGGKMLKSAYAIDTDGDDIPDKHQTIFDGAFHESYFRSAPYFSLDIDGITVLN